MNDFIIKTDEESYLAIDQNNRIYLTENIDEALKGSPLTLNNIRKTIPKKLKKHKPYYIIPYSNTNSNNSHNNISKDDILNNPQNTISYLLENLQFIICYESELRDELSKLDLQVSDLLHYIEFHKFSAAEGYKLSKKLQIVLDQRRELKNKIESICIIKKCSDISDGTLIKQLKNIDKKKYKPRILNDLFSEGKQREKDHVNINI